MTSIIERQTLFREVGAAWMQAQNEKILQHLPGTVAGEDPEELHDMRVATRRLRAAMQVCRPCFPRKAFWLWYRRVSGITSALGAVRDMDVQREAVIRRRDSLPSIYHADINRWLDRLMDERETARVHMMAELESWLEKRMSERLAEVLTRMADPSARIRARVAEASRLLLQAGGTGGECG